MSPIIKSSLSSWSPDNPTNRRASGCGSPKMSQKSTKKPWMFVAINSSHPSQVNLQHLLNKTNCSKKMLTTLCSCRKCLIHLQYIFHCHYRTHTTTPTKLKPHKNCENCVSTIPNHLRPHMFTSGRVQSSSSGSVKMKLTNEQLKTGQPPTGNKEPLTNSQNKTTTAKRHAWSKVIPCPVISSRCGTQPCVLFLHVEAT